MIQPHSFLLVVLGLLLYLGLQTGCSYPEIPSLNPPSASFTFQLNNCTEAPCQVVFTNTSTGDSSATYQWDFGDSSAINTEFSPTHTFQAGGTFPVKLSVSNLAGVDSASQAISIPFPGGGGGGSDTCETLFPGLTFSITNDNCEAPCAVVLKTEADAETYSWVFGDGEEGEEEEGREVTHIYTRPNNAYQATLSVTKNGQTCPITRTVAIDFLTFDTTYAGSGPITDIIELADGGYVWVGYQAQIRRIDKNGNETWAGSGYVPSDPENTHFYGIIQDLNGRFVALENRAPTFFNRSQPAWVRFEEGGNGGIFQKREALFANPEDGAATDIALADNGDYLIVGTRDETNRESLVQFRVSDGGSAEVTQFGSNSNGVIGGRIWQTDWGVFASGKYIGSNTSQLLVEEVPTSFGGNFLPFVPINADQVMAIEGPGNTGISTIELFPYSIGSGRGTRLISFDPSFTSELFPMEIIARKEGGYAGVALAFETDLQTDIEAPSGLFFLVDVTGKLESGFPKPWGLSSTSDFLFNIKQTRDGGFILVGSENGVSRIIKTDNQGRW